jgi:hypothetical protein
MYGEYAWCVFVCKYIIVKFIENFVVNSFPLNHSIILLRLMKILYENNFLSQNYLFTVICLHLQFSIFCLFILNNIIGEGKILGSFLNDPFGHQ